MLPMIATTSIIAALSMNLFALPVIAPQAAADMGLDPSWIGAYSASISGCAIMSALAAGAVVARWGAVRTGQICLVVGAAAALLAATGSVVPVALSAVALGLAFGPETPAASHLLARVIAPGNRALLFSIKQSGMQIGGIAAGLLMPLLLELYGWRAALTAIAVATLALSISLQRLHVRYDTDRDPTVTIRPMALKQSLRLVLHSTSLRSLAATAFCFSALQQCFNAFLVVYLVHHLGQSVASAGAVLAVAQIAGIAGRLVQGIAADRLFGARSVLVGVGILMTLGTAGLAMLRIEASMMVIMSVCVLVGFSATGWNGVFLAEVARIAPTGRASEVTGGMLSAAYAGLVFGPVMFGGLLRIGVDDALCYGVASLFAALGTSALLFLFGDQLTSRQGAQAATSIGSLVRRHEA